MTFWTSEASRKSSMGLKYMIWVCKTFSWIRGIEHTSNHVRTTRRTKTAYPIPKRCGKPTSETPIQLYFSNFKICKNLDFSTKMAFSLEQKWVWQITNILLFGQWLAVMIIKVVKYPKTMRICPTNRYAVRMVPESLETYSDANNLTKYQNETL